MELSRRNRGRKGKMTNQFSIEIHDHISSKMKYIEDKIQQAKELKNREQERFYEGQLEEFLNIRKYMDDSIDLKTQRYF